MVATLSWRRLVPIVRMVIVHSDCVSRRWIVLPAFPITVPSVSRGIPSRHTTRASDAISLKDDFFETKRLAIQARVQAGARKQNRERNGQRTTWAAAPKQGKALRMRDRAMLKTDDAEKTHAVEKILTVFSASALASLRARRCGLTSPMCPSAIAQ